MGKPALAVVMMVFSESAGAQGAYRQTAPFDPGNLDRTASACGDLVE